MLVRPERTECLYYPRLPLDPTHENTRYPPSGPLHKLGRPPHERSRPPSGRLHSPKHFLSCTNLCVTPLPCPELNFGGAKCFSIHSLTGPSRSDDPLWTSLTENSLPHLDPPHEKITPLPSQSEGPPPLNRTSAGFDPSHKIIPPDRDGGPLQGEVAEALLSIPPVLA